MTLTKRYTVIKEVKNMDIPERYINIIKMMKPIGLNFIRSDFVEKLNKTSKMTDQTIHGYVHTAIGIALDKKIIKTTDSKQLPSITSEFINLSSIQYWQKQLRGSLTKNTDSKHTTRTLYLTILWHFNCWLIDREFTVTRTKILANNKFEQYRTKTRFSSVDNLLDLLREPMADTREVIKIIKEYLLDDRHSEKSSGYMNLSKYAIQSYFTRHDYFIRINYDSKINHTDEPVEQSISIKELMAILTTGRPSLLEKAVILCKFHRGLDGSTLVDRFNFEAWDQIVKWFGSAEIDSWDLDKCPVPIKLTRIKTGFSHVGFLDIDAIDALQKYLKYREKKTGKPMTSDEPMFINKYNHLITNAWVKLSFVKLANRAGVRKCIRNDRIRKFNLDSHELRDLLKSTLIDCGCRLDVADHVIGHKPKDSYEKQSILYIDSFRTEYSKASKKLNLFTQFGNVVSGKEDVSTVTRQFEEKIQEMQNKIDGDENYRIRQEQQTQNQNRKLEKLHTEIHNLKNNMNSDLKQTLQKLEFCCASCSVIHSKDQCPNCGSKIRRIVED